MDSTEPTPRQVALLTYLGISVPADLTKDKASDMLEAALYDPQHEERLSSWRTDKLRLHPELYSEEVKTAREGRPQHFFNELHNYGAEFFYKFTRKQCAEVVRLLDEQYPEWNTASEADKTFQYFFPAYAQVFPGNVRKDYRGSWGAATRSES